MRVGVQLALGILLITPSSAWPQDSLSGSPVGCYDVEIGDWMPRLGLGGDSLFIAPPSRVELDTVSNPIGMLRELYALRLAPGAMPSIHRYSGWRREGVGLWLTWSTGFSGLTAVVSEVPEGFAGEAKSFWDFNREIQKAPLRLTKVRCDSRPGVTVEDQRPVLSSITVTGGPKLELTQPFTPGEGWEARKPGRSYVLKDAHLEGFGQAQSVEATVTEEGALIQINVILPPDFPLASQVSRIAELYGPPTGEDDRTLRSGTRGVFAYWANRTQAFWMRREQREDGTWESWFTVMQWGR